LVVAVERADDMELINKELHQAFEEVGGVLWEAPTPYAQLDSDDKIRICNKAMCDFLGYEYSVLLGKKFEDLVTDDDKIKYDVVQTKRREGKHVDAYPLSFVRGDAKQATAWIISAPVPALPTSEGNRLPETFGIFLHAKPSGRVRSINTAQATRK